MMKIYKILIFVFCLSSVFGCRCSKKDDDESYHVIKIKKTMENVIDLTYKYNNKSAYWPNNAYGFSLIDRVLDNPSNPVAYYASNSYKSPEHLGTHIDAPLHFFPGKFGTSDIPLKSLIGKGVFINMEKDGLRMGVNETVTIDHIQAFENERGKDIEEGSIVLLHTGYGRFYTDKSIYLGTNESGDKAIPHLMFPGLHPEAADWLATNRKIAAVGIDTASIDFGQSTTFTAHRNLAKNQVPVLENVANLHKLIDISSDFYVIALPAKIEEGTGGPLRMLAII